VLALFKSRRKVGFIEAWCVLQTSGCQYLCGMMHKVMYGTKVRMVRATRLLHLKVISKLSYLFPSLTPIS
jgi:hypothetical protein